MGNIELSLMKKTILVLRDWDAFQATCRQVLKMVRLDGSGEMKRQSPDALNNKRPPGITEV